MTNLNLLADSQSEMIAGGRGSSFEFVSNKVYIGQSNTATNVGLGLGGGGAAFSYQKNSAGVANIIAV
ncbi:MAG TPA: hypothetical protein DDY43_06075 [Synechococcales bacterium UBA10510]|nr:hypothetical protein [Synechococcales bacterium UBA10510]